MWRGLRYLERKPRTAQEMARRLREKEIGGDCYCRSSAPATGGTSAG
ncbi:hypothetical protein ACFSQ7_22160 [Paenibacillus rhizoplanae]